MTHPTDVAGSGSRAFEHLCGRMIRAGDEVPVAQFLARHTTLDSAASDLAAGCAAAFLRAACSGEPNGMCEGVPPSFGGWRVRVGLPPTSVLPCAAVAAAPCPCFPRTPQ